LKGGGKVHYAILATLILMTLKGGKYQIEKLREGASLRGGGGSNATKEKNMGRETMFLGKGKIRCSRKGELLGKRRGKRKVRGGQKSWGGGGPYTTCISTRVGVDSIGGDYSSGEGRYD